jgi:hypothetical protein
LIRSVSGADQMVGDPTSGLLGIGKRRVHGDFVADDVTHEFPIV